MTTHSCPRTEAVAAAARHGRLTDDAELATHARACNDCSEHLWLDELFAGDALALEAVAPLEDPRLLWLRARLEARGERTRRATWAIRAVERLCLAVGAVAAVILAAWAWPRLELEVALPTAKTLADTAGEPLTVLALAAALALGATAVDFYDRWSRT